MTVESFDPSNISQPMDDAAVRDLCTLGVALVEDVLQLSDVEVARFAPLATHGDWAQEASALNDADILGLIRVFTLGEMAYSSWAAGEKSAVVPLVNVLKSRGVYDAEIGRWIKTHTTNRFLPHGSLLDRL